MEWFAAPELEQARWLLQHGLALVYLLAFVNIVDQWRGLLGERGLLPVPAFVTTVPFRAAPSLFHWRYSDRLAVGLAWVGVALAGGALVGMSAWLPTWAGMLWWAALWALYSSYVNVGQVWYAFGWESLLLEAGFLAIFLGDPDVAPPVLVLWLFRWLLFRVEFGAGLIKMRGDPCWRDLTCLQYHHETQPLPGPLSWWFHRLRQPLHKTETLANHVVQLGMPFLLFLPQPIAGIAAATMIVTQGWLMLSGNFAWLNLVTIVLATAALPGDWLGWLPTDAVAARTPGPFVVVVVAVTVLVAVLSIRPAINLLSPRQRMNASFDPLHLVNTYGAFGSITRTRFEVEVEGTRDADPGRDAEWYAYRFRAKPGDPARRPRQIAPYHLRLDWLMWFLAMSPGIGHRDRWFPVLLDRLLAGDPVVRRLLAHDPFEDAPPRWVRVRRYQYRYTTSEERRRTGHWWVRDLVGEFVHERPADPRPPTAARRPPR